MRPPAVVSFATAAAVFAPAGGGRRHRVVELDSHWRVDVNALDTGHDAAVVGRGPDMTDQPLARLLSESLARERTLARLRSARHLPGDLEVVRVHRWPPPRLTGAGPAGRRVRAAARGGALVELAVTHGRAGPAPRILDVAVREAGAVGRVRRVRFGTGGSVHVTVHGSGAARWVRVGRAYGPADPLRAAGALAHLASVDADWRGVVPRLIGQGLVEGCSWTAESVLAGTSPRKLDREVAAALVGFCAGLPRSTAPATAPADHAAVVAAAWADRAAVVERLAADVQPVLAALPSITCHGDLWCGNILSFGKRLSGVVDWDSWHPAGVPGVDLLHVFATDQMLRRRSELGAVWLRRPWRSPEFAEWSAPYWHRLGVIATPEVLDTVGVAWWLTHVATALARLPQRARDETWVTRNIEPVLATVS